MNGKEIKHKIATSLSDRLKRTILSPISDLADENVTEVVTTFGSYIIRKVRGKFQRSIVITTGDYGDTWIEEALYSIIFKYNDLKKSSKLILRQNEYMGVDNTHYYLDDGVHTLKYRDYNILLCIQTKDAAAGGTGRWSRPRRVYTIITYDMNPKFMREFERDIGDVRRDLLKIDKDSPRYTIYKDGHEQDGYTYWERVCDSPKRRLNTIYIPAKTKHLIVDTINGFLESKKFYNDHGIAHNLKILLYGDPGLGKDSIAKMIASEWNRNLCYVTGGKDGRFIPNAITDHSTDTLSPLFLISDIDKYPFLINEPDFDMSDENAKEEKMKFKQAFGNMINALDGVLSGEDRIIVMTTNHIEKFSDAFLRPGRIDLAVELHYVTPEVFRQYVFDFYNVVLPTNIKLVSDKLRIADFQADTVFRKMTVDEFISNYVK